MSRTRLITQTRKRAVKAGSLAWAIDGFIACPFVTAGFRAVRGSLITKHMFELNGITHGEIVLTPSVVSSAEIDLKMP